LKLIDVNRRGKSHSLITHLTLSGLVCCFISSTVDIRIKFLLRYQDGNNKQSIKPLLKCSVIRLKSRSFISAHATHTHCCSNKHTKTGGLMRSPSLCAANNNITYSYKSIIYSRETGCGANGNYLPSRLISEEETFRIHK